jgi:hypothetical protein
MLRHMRTTIGIDDALMKRAKKESAKLGETFTSLIERSLRLVLAQSCKCAARATVRLPVCRKGSGTLPGVDIRNSADLLDRVEGIR